MPQIGSRTTKPAMDRFCLYYITSDWNLRHFALAAVMVPRHLVRETLSRFPTRCRRSDGAG